MKRTNTSLLSIATVVAAMAIIAGPAAALNKNATPVASSAASSQSVAGTLAGPQATTSAADDGSGFDWGDAAIGAAVALSLVVISVATAREVRRHRKVVVGSGA
jgi:hypothetical protein